MNNTSVVAKPAFGIFQHGEFISGDWTTRAAAVRVLESQRRYALAIGQSAEGLVVIQGGYDGDSGDKMMRVVYPKRTAWRLV
jgi:hypothetical protein